ncbi:MAG: response regulator transcription factor [Kiritimatiellae bacterium]|nr:response regulator transcription factor [Kiritimatiellia bacterium]
MKSKVLICDDHAVVRMGLRALFENEDDFCVVGEAKNGLEAVRMAAEVKPDIVLMDLMMPRLDGVEATQRILEAGNPRVLLLTSYSSSDGIARAIRAGACGVVMKNAEYDELLEAARQVVSGRQVIPRDIRRLLAEDPPVPELSPRQQEVLDSICRGLTNKDIAKQLGISVASVKSHLEVVFQKIGAATRAEAAAIAMRKHLLKL